MELSLRDKVGRCEVVVTEQTDYSNTYDRIGTYLDEYDLHVMTTMKEIAELCPGRSTLVRNVKELVENVGQATFQRIHFAVMFLDEAGELEFSNDPTQILKIGDPSRIVGAVYCLSPEKLEGRLLAEVIDMETELPFTLWAFVKKDLLIAWYKVDGEIVLEFDCFWFPADAFEFGRSFDWDSFGIDYQPEWPEQEDWPKWPGR